MKRSVLLLLLLLGGIAAFVYFQPNLLRQLSGGIQPAITVPISNLKIRQFVEAGVAQTTYTRSYDPAYVAIAYPGGDVPAKTGVCTDVVIRAFRKVGVDLQKEVHEDMSQAFAEYPLDWGLTQPDPNIDHRRVPNLIRFFERKGKALSITKNPQDYQPGDVVMWDLGQGNSHTGLVTNIRTKQSGRYYIVHNIGAGAKIEDVVFDWTIIGHYRYWNGSTL
jgi:uncharacterized protein